jgi:hypothetical protein
MNDIERLQSWFDDGTLLSPRGKTCTVHLARALASLAAAPIELDEKSEALAALIGESDHIVFVLADGLGMNLVETLPVSSFLRRHLAREVRSVFPASTAPALTSLATGLWPAEHAVTAWRIYLKHTGVSAISLPFIERFSGRSLDEMAVTSESLFISPPLMRLYKRPITSHMPVRIADSVYTRYVTGGTDVIAYDSIAEAVDNVVASASSPGGARFSYLYLPHIDTAEHAYGPESPQVAAALRELDSQLTRLRELLGGGARIVLSADHGQYGVAEEAKLFIEEDDELLDLLHCPPSGEPPVPFFHLRKGRARDFESLFRQRFGEQFALLTTDQVQELGLLGPGTLASETRARLGDYAALSPTGAVLLYRPEKGVTALKGQHAGLSRNEVAIPLIVS